MKAFIFDLDGVITDSAEYHYLAWKALGEELSIPFDREFNETLKGVSRTESLERILRLGGRENDFSTEEKEQLATKKNEHYVSLIKNITPDDVLPGIEAFLSELKQAGYKIGMASASKNALMVTRQLGLLDAFDHIVDAATVAQSKPDPEVFLKAAEALGVEPKACIGVEDAVAGVEAIHAAGMFAVGIGDLAVLTEANIVFTDTTGLTLDNVLTHI
ncbi:MULTISPECIES: beta-phosphoglucomutase [unclassified Exiguobacterium]|uniref:beta-phosphoglucomutase n=1 Tax=unclassified Exiguobacterium TaxID=2644629 RepID=UPI00103DAFA1|nr:MULTISPECIES: beta-phosphoglucomutase [unclassified Exiguobacterium]TCI48340.1 beta-phosphoglucomutase [Exiguobacterium sp. SH5S32]TCI55228.1 beta-phosphoglucomutase [Exiguobacterium sp. SH1S4]TCI75020.1 beta-phosphoglucomutase [Exiguobacterium sp. SH1S1]